MIACVACMLVGLFSDHTCNITGIPVGPSGQADNSYSPCGPFHGHSLGTPCTRVSKRFKDTHPGSPPLELPPCRSCLLPLPSQDEFSESFSFVVKRRRFLSAPLTVGYYPHGRPPDGHVDNLEGAVAAGSNPAMHH